MKKLILFAILLLFFTACEIQDICLKVVDAPVITDTYFENRTEHTFSGDIELILTSCNEAKEKIYKKEKQEMLDYKEDPNDKRSSICNIDGQKWECNKAQYCEESILDGMKVGVCHKRDKGVKQ